MIGRFAPPPGRTRAASCVAKRWLSQKVLLKVGLPFAINHCCQSSQKQSTPSASKGSMMSLK